MFYTYALKNPETKLPFYIGVGKENRRSNLRREQQHKFDALKLRAGKKLLRPNKHKLYTILQILDKNLEPEIEIISHFENEKDAFQHEMLLIHLYGRKDLETGILTNMTDGSDGMLNPSIEARQKSSNLRKGRPSPLKGRKFGKYSEERKQKAKNAIRESWTAGRVAYNKGKTHEELYGKEKAEELKKFYQEKASIQFKGKPSHRKGKTGIYSKETLQKHSDNMKGNTYAKGTICSDETRKKLSDSCKGKTYEERYGMEKAAELKEKRRIRKIEFWKNKNSLEV